MRPRRHGPQYEMGGLCPVTTLAAGDASLSLLLCNITVLRRKCWQKSGYVCQGVVPADSGRRSLEALAAARTACRWYGEFGRSGHESLMM